MAKSGTRLLSDFSHGLTAYLAHSQRHLSRVPRSASAAPAPRQPSPETPVALSPQRHDNAPVTHLDTVLRALQVHQKGYPQQFCDIYIYSACMAPIGHKK